MNHEVIQWTCEKIAIEVSPLGAELQSVRVNGGDNLLWSKDDQHWNRVAPNLFPFVGRLKEDQFRFLGRDFSMKQHGFARDWEFRVVANHPDSLRFRLVWNETTLLSYPFNFQYDVIYTAVGGMLWVEYEICNLGEESMLYSVGGHPGFAIQGDLENYELRFEEKFAADRWLIDGAYYSGATERMEVDGRLKLEGGLFEKDAIVFRHPPFDRVSLWERGGIKRLDFVCSEWDAVGFWTKGGAPFFCIEPWWGWADAWADSGELTEKGGMHILPKGAFQKHRYGFGVMD